MKTRLVCFLLALGTLQFAVGQQSNMQKPEVALLGMFHFGETNDLAAIKMADLRGKRRQADIKDLVKKLMAYKPTKVLVEHPLNLQDTLQKRYQAYLNGNFELLDSETYQIGFRLAKGLGHTTIYAMDHKMNLDFDALNVHLAKTGQQEKLMNMIGEINNLMASQTQALESMSLAAFLKSMNSASFDALANSLYLKEILEMGTPDNPVGAEISATWYKRNMVMLANIASYVESANERLLVIVGSSHRAVLRDYIEDRLDLDYVEIAKFLD